MSRSFLPTAAVVGCAALAVANLTVPSLTGEPAPNKPFATWAEFYPYYQSEHQDHTCRVLHFVGTTLVLLLMMARPKAALSMGIAACVGVPICQALIGIESGFVEFGMVGATFVLAHKALGGDMRVALMLPLVGYAFAWVGHFGFEQNKPATFIYPTYSLISDFRMWFNIATARERF